MKRLNKLYSYIQDIVQLKYSVISVLTKVWNHKYLILEVGDLEIKFKKLYFKQFRKKTYN